MEQFTVTGMHCAACSARVEKAVLKVPGVTSCAVSLLTNSMGVEGDADDRLLFRLLSRRVMVRLLMVTSRKVQQVQMPDLRIRTHLY